MSGDRKVTNVALSKSQGMTLDELRTFINDCSRGGVHPDTPVRVQNGWRRQLESISADLPPEDLDRLEGMLRRGG